MALRTPGLQPRSQFAAYWGSFANPRVLPNAAGAPLSASLFALEAGDEAYCENTSCRYVCESPGTAGGGDAIWHPSGPVIANYVTTPTIGDFYQAAAGNGDGGADFLVAVWQRDVGPDILSPGQRYHIASGGKWEIFWNFGVLGYTFIDGTGANTINLGATAAFANNIFYVIERDNLLMLRVTGGAGTATIRGYSNGVQFFSNLAANPGVGAGTAGLKLGGQGAFGAAFRGGVQGAAYLDGTVTDAQIRDFTEACFRAGGIVDGGIAWTSLYDQTTAPGATWVDQQGVANLTRNGTPGSIRRQTRIA